MRTRAPLTALLEALALLALLFCLTSAAHARMAEVVLKEDGKVLKGEVVDESAEKIILKIAGIQTTIKKTDISKVTYVKSLDEEYNDQDAALKADDVDGRYKLANEMYSKKRYDLALKQLERLRKDFPDNRRVQLLLEIVQEGMKKPEVPKVDPKPPKDPKDPPKDPIKDPGAHDLPRDMLGEAQINRIRLLEVNFEDRKQVVNVHVPDAVVDAFLERYKKEDGVPRSAADIKAFKREKDLDQLRTILKVADKDAEFLDQIKVATDPAPLMQFRKELNQRFLQQHCATVGCHGGKQAGNLFLFRSPGNSDAAIYTNFFILQSFANDDGALIDRDRPERSLILSYALADAKKAHPVAKDYRAPFKSESDPMYLHLLDWIDKSLNKDIRDAKDYGVDYVPPKFDKDGKLLTPAAKPAPGKPPIGPKPAPGTGKPAPATTPAAPGGKLGAGGKPVDAKPEPK